MATESIRQGDLGTPVLLNEYEYSHHTDSDGRTVHTLAKPATIVRQDSIDTSYSYAYYTGTNAVEERVTTLPVVSIGQNGSGVAATRTERLDAYGRVVWSKDERGAITHYEYDAPTGAITRMIEDVDTSLVDDEPAGWTTVTGFGLHLVTDYEHDDLGRITQVLGPAHMSPLPRERARDGSCAHGCLDGLQGRGPRTLDRPGLRHRERSRLGRLGHVHAGQSRLPHPLRSRWPGARRDPGPR